MLSTRAAILYGHSTTPDLLELMYWNSNRGCKARLAEEAANNFAARAYHLLLRHETLLQQPHVHDSDDGENFWPKEVGHINVTPVLLAK